MQRIKSRADGFVNQNYESLLEQSKIVALYHDKLKKQLHYLMQITNLRNAKNPHFVGEDGGVQFLKTLDRAEFL